MITKVRKIIHKTLKKKLDDVDETDAPFLSFEWNDEDTRSFAEYLAEMKAKLGGDFTVKEIEDSNGFTNRKYINTRLSQIPDGPEKELLELLLKDRIQS